MVAPDVLAKLTARTARSEGGVRGGVRAGGVMTQAESDAAPASAPPRNARPSLRPRFFDICPRDRPTLHSHH